MRYHVAMCLALLAIEAVVADDSTAFEWSPERSLTWDDFRGPVPAGTDDRRVAATATSLSWEYGFTVRWSQRICTFTIDRIESKALFHPQTSWVRDGHRTDRVLGHEQGHFDILELYKHEFVTQTDEYIGSSHGCRGRNEHAATRNAKRVIEDLVGSTYARVWQAYRDRQRTYDDETQHGTDPAAQADWSDTLEAALGDLRAR